MSLPHKLSSHLFKTERNLQTNIHSNTPLFMWRQRESNGYTGVILFFFGGATVESMKWRVLFQTTRVESNTMLLRIFEIIAAKSRIVAWAHIGQKNSSPIRVGFQLPVRTGNEGSELGPLSCLHQSLELVLMQAAKHHWHLCHVYVPDSTAKFCKLSSSQPLYMSAS